MICVIVTIGNDVFYLDQFNPNSWNDPADNPQTWIRITELISRWTEFWNQISFVECPITVIEI